MGVPMDAERWKRIEDLLQSALRVPADQQEAFVRQACAGDTVLEQEIQSLLSSHGKLGDFLEPPAPGVARQVVAQIETPENSDTLLGQTIAHYLVLRKLG